jgi:hypothetical protein
MQESGPFLEQSIRIRSILRKKSTTRPIYGTKYQVRSGPKTKYEDHINSWNKKTISGPLKHKVSSPGPYLEQNTNTRPKAGSK